MTLHHIDLNKADMLYHSHCYPPYRTFGHSYKIQNGDDIRPNLPRLINKFMKVGGIKTWKELTIGVHQLVRLLLTKILSTPDVSFKEGGIFERCPLGYTLEQNDENIPARKKKKKGIC